MASGYGKKKSIKEKFNDLVRKVVGITLVAGVASTPVYYHYGTIKEQDVKVESYDSSNIQWNYETGQNEGYYTINTDKGSFILAPSRLHFRTQDEANKAWNGIYSGRTYHIKTYGMHLFSDWQPNILAARQLTDKELEARAAAAEKAKEKANTKDGKVLATDGQPGATPATTAQQPTGTAPAVVPGLSGEVVTYPVVVGGYSVQLTVPVEAVGKVTVNTVRPVAAPVVAPPRPPGS